RLTALGRDEIKAELDKLAVEIADYLDILRSRARIQAIIKEELIKIKDEFATPRRTVIADEEGEVADEDLIQREDMVVTVSHLGYVKRVPLSTYRAQKRGGKGRGGMQVREEDFVSRLFVASTHTPVLFFSSAGKVYKEKVWRLPLAAPQAKGKAMVNILPLAEGETITTIMPLPEDEKTWAQHQLMFATVKGIVRKIALEHYAEVRPSGLKAIKLEEGDSIAAVELCRDDEDVLLTTREGQCIRFPVTKTSLKKGRDTIGDFGIKLGETDEVISMTMLRHVGASPEERAAYLKRANAVRRGGEEEAAEVVEEADAEETTGAIELGEKRYVELSAAEQFVLTISEKGYGKRTSSYEYRITGRGGKGIVAMNIWEGKKGAETIRQKTGRLAASFSVEEADQVMLVTDAGKLIRTPVAGIRIAGRSTQGVIVLDTADDERVVSVERVSEEEGE
ncbi:MAG TPA: DNA gyrase C-terminal beta-propeller domain-containing protein, partial [Pseudolabrys sp.]|nr:DNA gyrase C-terminal beta-propeller domain-containing protein [Pseudolabrys sp.]